MTKAEIIAMMAALRNNTLTTDQRAALYNMMADTVPTDQPSTIREPSKLGSVAHDAQGYPFIVGSGVGGGQSRAHGLRFVDSHTDHRTLGAPVGYTVGFSGKAPMFRDSQRCMEDLRKIWGSEIDNAPDVKVYAVHVVEVAR